MFYYTLKFIVHHRMSIFHKSWPYPRNKREFTQVGLASGLLLALVAGGWLVVILVSPHNLQKNDLQDASKDLAGYLQEMKLLTKISAKAPLAANYRSQYLEQLHKDFGDIKNKFYEAKPEPSLKPQAKSIRWIAQKASLLSSNLGQHNSPDYIRTNLIRAERLQKELARAERSL